eukprot:gene7590-9037_t
MSKTIYVGNLPSDIRERDLEDLFYKYGHIVEVELKMLSRPPGFAFVEFEDERDADEAVHGRDGYNLHGNRLRVELVVADETTVSTVLPVIRDMMIAMNPLGRMDIGEVGRVGKAEAMAEAEVEAEAEAEEENDFNGVSNKELTFTFGFVFGKRSFGGISRRTEFRVTVSGLPASASWQDLKDHMRKAGDVCFAQVFRDSYGTTGVVDYTTNEDMKTAIRKLDDTEFRNPFDKGYIRVREEGAARSRKGKDSRSKSPEEKPRKRYSSDEEDDEERHKKKDEDMEKEETDIEDKAQNDDEPDEKKVEMEAEDKPTETEEKQSEDGTDVAGAPAAREAADEDED